MRLIDLSHTQFVHGDRLKSSSYSAAEMKVEQGARLVDTRLSIPGSDVPQAYKPYLPANVELVAISSV